MSDYHRFFCDSTMWCATGLAFTHLRKCPGGFGRRKEDAGDARSRELRPLQRSRCRPNVAQSLPAQPMIAYPIEEAIGLVRNDGPELVLAI
jgi:hypothetical protein